MKWFIGLWMLQSGIMWATWSDVASWRLLAMHVLVYGGAIIMAWARADDALAKRDAENHPAKP